MPQRPRIYQLRRTMATHYPPYISHLAIPRPLGQNHVMNRILLALIFACSALITTSSTEAQNTPAAEAGSTKNLESILLSIQKIDRDLQAKQEEMRGRSGEGRKEEITKQIQGLVVRLNQLESNFQKIATGVDPEAFNSKQDAATIDWTKDLQEILSPIINEVRRLTSRPREIDRLRTAIEEAEGQLTLLDQAEKNIKAELAQQISPELATYLEGVVQGLGAKRQEITTNLGVAQQNYRFMTADRKPFAESIQNIFQLFFKSRGLNLVIATLCAFGFWLFARRIHLFTSRVLPPSTIQRGYYLRLLSVLFTLSTIFGAAVVFLLALYFVGDWVLLILALMLILGIIWTSKQAFHQFWTHATLLLNMGVAREGERVIYHGIPWKVESLNFYSHLKNPQLVGGDIYLPIRDLADLRSRAFEPGEPWFPTKTGDWVLLSDRGPAKVVHQSVDQVQVVFLGGAAKTFTTLRFIEEAPTNLSYGFRHAISFGLDYGLQASITSEIPELLKQHVQKGLSAAGFSTTLKNLVVDFEEAGSSSLNLSVIADFDGAAAPDHSKLRRLLHRLCVDASNTYRWTIPFPQMTVHMADTTASSTTTKQR